MFFSDHILPLRIRCASWPWCQWNAGPGWGSWVWNSKDHKPSFFGSSKGTPLTPPKSHRIKSWSIHWNETSWNTWTASWNVKLETWWSRRKQHTIGHSYRNSNENIQFGLTLLFAKLEFKWPAVRRTLSRQMSTYICQPSVKRLWEIMMDP